MGGTIEDIVGVLVVSICEKPPKGLLERFCPVEKTESAEAPDGLIAYSYAISTKYFTANIKLYTTDDFGFIPDSILEKFESLVVIFDGNCDNFKEKSEIISSLLSKCDSSEINLLVCESCDNESIKNHIREKLSSFELIELDADDCEGCGFDRLRESLHMHTWSNLVMHEKNKLPGNPKHARDLLNAPAESMEPIDVSVLNSQGSSGDGAECQAIASDSALAEPVEESQSEKENLESTRESDEVSFEELFAKFATMKNQADSLSGEARKKFAEDVVLQFWRAMGQDESEIAGLSDSD